MPTAIFTGFPKEAIRFLAGLKRNNRREWFQPRKHLFEQHVKAPMLELVTALNTHLARFAPDYVTDPTKAIFRIYRDTRFSADKTPYKTHIAAWFRRRGPKDIHLGGFYVSVSPEQIEVAGGLYRPSPETTLLVRTHISKTHQELRKILANPKARRLMGGLQGDELTRSPKGFDPAHPASGFIKKKDWILDITLDPGLATTPQLHREIADRFRAMTPLIEYLNRPLLSRKATAPRDFLGDIW
jgi:uncharacterized protein (TIGR02453 family)